MEIIEINMPPGSPGNFFCPLTGEPAVNDSGALAASCIAYIPPLAFADALIECPQFKRHWIRMLKNTDRLSLQEDIAGEGIKDFLESYEEPQNQKLIGFAITTTTLQPRVAPEFSEPIFKLPFFYVVNFWI